MFIVQFKSAVKREAEEVRAIREAEEAKAKREADEAKAIREAEETKAKREAEEVRAIREAEEAKAKREAEEVRAIREAEEAKTKREIEAKKDEEEAQRRFQLQLEKMKNEHEQQMEKLRQNQTSKPSDNAYMNAPMPELPMFDEVNDNIADSLKRFERFAKSQKWDTSNYAVYLSALLTGKALKVYSRLEDSEATDYTKIKQALLKNYNLTEEGFREKFRRSRPKHDESPEQYFTRLENYCNGWFETAGVSTYEEIKSLIVREQFLDMCPQNLTVHLKERSFTSVTQMCAQADRFLQARKQKLFDNQGKIDSNNKEDGDSETDQKHKKDCYNCGKSGHIRVECRNQGGGNEQKCNNCNMYGHLEETCRNKKEFGGCMRTRCISNRRRCNIKPQYKNDITVKYQSKNQACMSNRFQPVKGKVNNHVVNTIRDTGCSTVCVNKKLVLLEQFTGRYKMCDLIDGTTKTFETAEVNIDTPYIRRKHMPVMCIENPPYDLVIGEVEGARCKCDPNPSWRLDNYHERNDKYKPNASR